MSENFLLRATGGDKDRGKTEKQRVKKQQIEEFLKCINALLNTGYGYVFIHTDAPKRLGLFDEAVDNKMLKMIPDDSFFHENFDRFFHDAEHVVYRVIPRNRPISTYNFNTKVSTDHGLVDPTHGQMRRFLTLQSSDKGQQSTEGTHTPEWCIFKKNQEVEVELTVQGERKRVAFQENRTTQAKRFKSEDVSSLIPDYSDILPSYISAFCKQPNGGSIYFGVYEHKTEEDKWTEKEGVDIDGQVNKKVDIPGFKLYQDNGEKERLYHIARNDYPVPVITQLTTGEFRSSGIVLTKPQQEEVKTQITTLVRSQMKCGLPAQSGWTNDDTCPLTDVIFHSVGGGRPQEVVVQIHTNKYKGVAFCHPNGPLAYKYLVTEDGSREPIPIDDWIRKNIDFAKQS